MSRLTQASLVASAVFAVACGRDQPPAEPRPGKVVQTGVASFYGSEFAGKETATGEKMSPDAMTAASRTLPLGSRVQVTNQETGQSARVRINDRGPYVQGRVIDLTPKAARDIGIDRREGVGQVSIRAIPQPEPSKP
jgi:rare lipoprotein A